jgi:aromatic ring-opening dioxygenase catalytic subunit (LigB family)
VEKTLQLMFSNEQGRTVTISVADPKADLTQAEVVVAMSTLIDKNAFISTGGSLIAPVGARIVSRGVEIVLQ